MKSDLSLREILELVRTGVKTPVEAEQEIQQWGTGHVGSIATLDLGRTARCGIPEVILAEGKEPEHLLLIAEEYAQEIRSMRDHQDRSGDGCLPAGTGKDSWNGIRV